MSTCTNEEAMAALGFLHRSFTCTDIDAQAERSLLATFRKYTSVEVRDGLEHFKAVSAHWPLPAQLEKFMTEKRDMAASGARDRARQRRYGPFLEDHDETFLEAVLWCANLLAAKAAVSDEVVVAGPPEIIADPEHVERVSGLREALVAGREEYQRRRKGAA